MKVQSLDDYIVYKSDMLINDEIDEDTEALADGAAYSLTNYEGLTENTFWIYRDQLRLAAGTWQHIPAADWLNEIDKRYALHVAQKDPTLVAYTPWETERDLTKAKADIQIITRLGKFLMAKYVDRFSAREINDISNAYQNRNVTSKQSTPKYSLEMYGGDDIGLEYASMHDTGLRSCMAKPWNTWGLRTANGKKVYPTSLYGMNEHVRLAVLVENKTGHKLARCMVNIRDKVFTRIYGNTTIMEGVLHDNGYKSGSLRNLEFPLVEVFNSNPPYKKTASPLILAPFLDQTNRFVIVKNKLAISTQNHEGVAGSYQSGGFNASRCLSCDTIYIPRDGQGTKYIPAWNLHPQFRRKYERGVTTSSTECPNCNSAPEADPFVRGACLINNDIVYRYAPRSFFREVNSETVPNWGMPNESIYVEDRDDVQFLGESNRDKRMYPLDMLQKVYDYREDTDSYEEVYEPRQYPDQHTMKCYTDHNTYYTSHLENSGRFWKYKNRWYYKEDRVKAVISRKKARGYRPITRCIQTTTGDYYDKGFTIRYLRHDVCGETRLAYTPSPGRPRTLIHADSCVFKILGLKTTNAEPGTYRYRYATEVERSANNFTQYWESEESQEAAQAAA